MLRRWGTDVVAFGPSSHAADTYFLVRAYADPADLNARQDAFYGSSEWREKLRAKIVSFITTYLSTVLWMSPVSVDDLRRSNASASRVKATKMLRNVAGFVCGLFAWTAVATLGKLALCAAQLLGPSPNLVSPRVLVLACRGNYARRKVLFRTRPGRAHNKARDAKSVHAIVCSVGDVGGPRSGWSGPMGSMAVGQTTLDSRVRGNDDRGFRFHANADMTT